MVKKLQKSSSQELEVLTIGMQHCGLNVYKVYINDDPGLTCINFTAMSNLTAYGCEWEKRLQCHLMGKPCSKCPNGQIFYMFENILTHGGCLPRGYIHVYHHYFQTSSSL